MSFFLIDRFMGELIVYLTGGNDMNGYYALCYFDKTGKSTEIALSEEYVFAIAKLLGMEIQTIDGKPYAKVDDEETVLKRVEAIA